MIRVSNIRLQNYIEERGIQPVREEYGVAFYRTSPKLLQLLEAFDIEYICFKNRK